MLIEQMPDVVRHLYPQVLWRKDKQEKCVYLSIDDGPTELITPWLLDELDRQAVKATFFCIGKNVETLPELYQEIRKRGHSVGLHGYSHVRGLSRDTQVFLDDIKHGAEFVDSHLLRPPHGHISPQQARILSKQYQLVLWDVITRDYNPALSPEKVYHIATKYARNGSIIVFHDSLKAAKNMQWALPRAIAHWKAQGYTFKTL